MKTIKQLGSFFKELYQNRKLLVDFAKNDFKAKYAGSAFGVFWAFLNPLVTVITYWFVFDVGLKAPLTDGQYPFICFLLTGIVAWFFFSDVLSTATNCFREYSYLVKKVVFDIKILPTAKLVSNFYTHIFFIGITFIVTIANGYYPTVQSLQLLYYMFCLAMFLTGLTWITASIQPFFSDVSQFIGVIMQTLMWATPVLWSPNQFQSETIRFLFKLNPLYYVVQGYRESFFSSGWFWQHWAQTIYFWVATIILLIVGNAVYNRLNPHFSDVL